jgi:hypothetical protein
VCSFFFPGAFNLESITARGLKFEVLTPRTPLPSANKQGSFMGNA